MRNPEDCSIYVTKSTRKLLRTTVQEFNRLGCSLSSFAWLAEVPCWKVRALFHGDCRLTVREFLTLSHSLNWDISLNVNFLWAVQAYSAEDISRRLHRLSIGSLRNIPVHERYHLKRMLCCLYGVFPETPRQYYRALKFIRDREIERRYYDCIDMED